MVRSLQTESRAHLALGGLTTPTIVTKPEALFILTPEAALESHAAEGEIFIILFAGFSYMLNGVCVSLFV